eukprot:98841-Chlamydomonas_euryale.AAC.1
MPCATPAGQARGRLVLVESCRVGFLARHDPPKKFDRFSASFAPAPRIADPRTLAGTLLDCTTPAQRPVAAAPRTCTATSAQPLENC